MKTKIIIFLFIWLVSGCTANTDNLVKENTNSQQNTNQEKPTNSNDNQIVCAQDVKECPDGSYVARVAPDCQFAECPVTELIKPIKEFDSRITKKPFGIYITPENSPVQPEKFSGYHTGVDVEYEDMPEAEIPVYAIAEGQIVRSGWVSGYGGMIAISHQINGQQYLAIYGHLNPNSLTADNSPVSSGEQIGILGKGYSYETDYERKHLHFAIYTGSDINVRGYVATKEELKKWLDPVKFFKNQ